MAFQNHMKESVLMTAMQHILRNKDKSPERTSRNIMELFELVPGEIPPEWKKVPFAYGELLEHVKDHTKEETLDWILRQIKEE